MEEMKDILEEMKTGNVVDHQKRPDTFQARSRVRLPQLPLIAVDSAAGRNECLAQTQKQWETIIEKAKADGKVLDVMKAAKFFHFGTVIMDPKPLCTSEAYVFSNRLSESEVATEIDGAPIPLKDYSARRRVKMRLRLRTSHELNDIENLPAQTTSPELLHNNSPTSLGESNQKLDSSEQKLYFHTNMAKRFRSGHDLSYLKFAAEEHLNDSELVKGIGRVPINRKTPEPVKPVEDKAWELPLDAWALRDLKFLLQEITSSDWKINNYTSLPSATALNLDDLEALVLKWNGKTEQQICVVKGDQLKCIHFRDVIAIKYNRDASKLLFQFSSENRTTQEELLLVLSPVSDTDWQILQTCCYSLVKGKPSVQQCDKEEEPFFENKDKALKNLRKKYLTRALTPNRPALQSMSKGVGSRQKPRIPEPISESLPGVNSDLEEDLGNLSSNKDSLGIETHTADNPSLDIEDEDENTVPSSIVPENSLINAEHEGVEKTASTNIVPENNEVIPRRLYYKSSFKSGVPALVSLNDVVVRLRSETERERGGKRDKLDLFDGPWRIEQFECPEKSIVRNASTDKDNKSLLESPTSPHYSTNEMKKMLKSKVMLNFPQESLASPWVELSQLLPVCKLEDVRNGKLHASCWAVTELSAFKVLQAEMESRNLSTFDPQQEKLHRKTSADSETNIEDANADSTGSADEGKDDLPMHVVEIKKDIFVAMMEANPKAIDDDDIYLVEKLRSKRLRLLKLNSQLVKKHNLKTDERDPWVKLLLKEMPELAKNRVVVSEYKVHWAGWTDEDDTWDVGYENIAQGFIDEFHKLTDVLRDITADIQVLNPRDMVFNDDLPKQKIGRSSGRGRRCVSTTLQAKVNDNDAPVAQKGQDVEMDEDGDITMAEALQSSLEDTEAAKTKAQLEELQKEMGVAFKEPDDSTIHDAAVVAENNISMEYEQDEDMEEEEDTENVVAESGREAEE